MNCPYCYTELPERGIFCPSCGQQARCKTCRDALEPNGLVCVMCGTPMVSTGETALKPTTPTAIAPNTIRFRETSKERTFDATLSDLAVSEVSQALGQFMAAGLGQPMRRRHLVNVAGSQVVEHPTPGTPLISQNNDREQSSSAQDIEQFTPGELTDESSEVKLLSRIFRGDGDLLRLHETRLKARSKRDAVRRVVLLCLYYYELKDRDKIERAMLVKLLQDSSLYDSNASRWINEAGELHIEDDFVSLREPGKDQAKAALREIFDSSIPDNWTIGTASQSRNRQKLGKDKQDSRTSDSGGQGKTGTQVPKKVAMWLKQWKDLGHTSQEYHAKLVGRSALEQALVGLWAIRLAGGETEGKTVSRDSLAIFIFQAFEIKLNGRSLERALKSTDAKDLVLRVKGVTFQISPSGQKRAQEIMSA